MVTYAQLISIANNSKEREFRQRADDLPTPKLLARVEQLRLLSKLEELKLLSLLQNNGGTAYLWNVMPTLDADIQLISIVDAFTYVHAAYQKHQQAEANKEVRT